MHQTPLAQPFVGTCRTSPFLFHTFSVAWARKDWLEVPPTIDKFVMVHLLTNFASQPFLSWPYVGLPQISWWGNDLGFPKPPCMCIIMYDETSLVTPPKVRALHCDVIFGSSWRQCRRRQGEAFSVCGHLNSSVTCGPVVPRQVVCSAVFLPYLNQFWFIINWTIRSKLQWYLSRLKKRSIWKWL